MATWNENVELAEVLIQLGLDVNEAHGVTFPRVYIYYTFACIYSFMKFCCTPLHWAASKGNCELGELLIGEGAALEVKDEVTKRFIGTIFSFMTFRGVSLLSLDIHRFLWLVAVRNFLSSNS